MRKWTPERRTKHLLRVSARNQTESDYSEAASHSGPFIRSVLCSSLDSVPKRGVEDGPVGTGRSHCLVHCFLEQVKSWQTNV